MDENNTIAPVVDAPVVDAPVTPAAPVIQADTGERVGLMLDNDGGGDVQAKETDENSKSDSTDNTATNVGDDNSGSTGEVQADSVKQPIQEAPVSEPAPQLVDPGEFIPNDYSFDVKLADGSTVKINTPEDIEALGADVEFASAADLIKTQANYSRMVAGIEADKKAYETEKSAYDTAQEQIQQQEQFISGIESGMGYLESSGALPPVPAQYENADWSDPEVAKQPGVKERVALIEYMATENAKRDRAGVPRLNSVLDAHNAMKLDALEKANTVKADAAKAATKARGAMVGGETSQSQGGSNVPDNMIVGTGGNIRDIGYRIN